MGDTLKRQWSLVQLLQSRRYGVTLDELAGELGCNRRTIQRDINVLREVGLPIQFATSEDQHGQRCYAPAPAVFFDGNELLLTITEALSLYLAKSFMAPLAGTSIGDAFDSLLKRIEHSLSDKTVRHFRDLQGLLLVLSPGQPDYSKCREIVSAIDTAIREHRILKIAYHSQWRGDEYTTEIHPYGLVFWQTDLYLVAFSCHAEAIRVFKITRIRSSELTSKPFAPPRGLRPGGPLRVVAFGDALRPAVRGLRRVYGPSGKPRPGTQMAPQPADHRPRGRPPPREAEALRPDRPEAVDQVLRPQRPAAQPLSPCVTNLARNSPPPPPSTRDPAATGAPSVTP